MTEKQTQPSAIAQAAAKELHQGCTCSQRALTNCYCGNPHFSKKMCDGCTALIQTAAALIDKHIAQLTQQLAECFRLTGADPDGNEDWRLAPQAVREVKHLREESDATEKELLKAEAEIERLTRIIDDWKSVAKEALLKPQP